MKVASVTYTTRADFAEQNQNNIRSVMSDLQKLQIPGIRYTSCLKADGKTFIHTLFFKSDEDQKTLSQLPSFKHFQAELQASGLEMPPKQETLSLVGSSNDILS